MKSDREFERFTTSKNKLVKDKENVALRGSKPTIDRNRERRSWGDVEVYTFDSVKYFYYNNLSPFSPTPSRPSTTRHRWSIWRHLPITGKLRDQRKRAKSAGIGKDSLFLKVKSRY